MPRIEKTTKTASRAALAVFWAAAACLMAAPSASFARGQKPEVLIYYANETAPDETESGNYATLIAWLEGSRAKKARKSAESLHRDVLLFPAAVDLETHTIRHMLPRSGSGAGAVIFTNRLVRRGKFLLYRPGWEEFEEMAITPPEFDNYILTSNPLCVEECFAAMLAEVARRFDPARHRFLLVTKSHGSRTMSLVPHARPGADRRAAQRDLRSRGRRARGPPGHQPPTSQRRPIMTWYVDSRGNATDRPPWVVGPLRRVPAEPDRKPMQPARGWSPGEIRALTVLFIFLAAVLLFGVIGSLIGPACDKTLHHSGVIRWMEVEPRKPVFAPSRLPEDDLLRRRPLEVPGFGDGE